MDERHDVTLDEAERTLAALEGVVKELEGDMKAYHVRRVARQIVSRCQEMLVAAVVDVVEKAVEERELFAEMEAMEKSGVMDT
jgi:hypothetical protein